jgi:hypothetical protein
LSYFTNYQQGFFWWQIFAIWRQNKWGTSKSNKWIFEIFLIKFATSQKKKKKLKVAKLR